MPTYGDVPRVRGALIGRRACAQNHARSCCQRSTIVEFGAERGFAEYETKRLRLGGPHASSWLPIGTVMAVMGPGPRLPFRTTLPGYCR